MTKMEVTTIKVYAKTKDELDSFREYRNESYEELIQKLIFIAKNTKQNPRLSKDTINAIEAARERMKKGSYISEKDAARRLGL